MLVLALLALNGGFGQANLVSNGNFESGTLPTAHDQLSNATGWSAGCAEASAGVQGKPDLIDSRTTHHLTRTPMSGHINPRNVSGNNRFAAFNGKAGPLYGESIKGTITSPLTINSAYTVSLYAALWNYPSNVLPDPIFQIQVILRKNEDCAAGKVVYTTPTFQLTTGEKIPLQTGLSIPIPSPLRRKTSTPDTTGWKSERLVVPAFCVFASTMFL